MSPRRLKFTLILAGIVLSGLTLLAWAQPWFGFDLIPSGAVAAAGDVAAPALTALALAGLALAAALSIAGRVFRAIMGFLQVAIGALVVASAAAALSDPVTRSASAITALTGISGAESVGASVSEVSITAWPYVGLGCGILLVLLGATIVLSGRRWPESSRRYQTVRLQKDDGSPISDWDALSDGRDPT